MKNNRMWRDRYNYLVECLDVKSKESNLISQ